MKLWTSYYANKGLASADVVPVQASLGRPRFRTPVPIIVRLRELAPPGWLFKSDLPADEWAAAYRQHLDGLGIDRIRAHLEAVYAEHDERDLALLCFEKPGEFCHRRLFASWWEEQTGEGVAELPNDL